MERGRLTTHVLDTAQGCPAAHMALALWRITVDAEGMEQKACLQTLMTNGDGRTDMPLLVGAGMQVGIYELVFEVATYFASQALPQSTPPFLDRVPIRFAIADPYLHYHVPLLVSPWAYSTYRGS